MKPLIVSLIFFLISFVLFSTCSKDSNPVVTSTEKNKNLSLEKKKKNWPAVIYDSTYGEIVMDYNVITPTAFPCGIKDTYGWGWDHYQSKAGKYLGIQKEQSFWADAYNKYGFTQIGIYNRTERDIARNIGFKWDSMFVWLNNYSSAINTINDVNYGFGEIKYVRNFFVDEPIERNTWAVSNLQNIAEYLYNNIALSKMYLVSYKWPTVPYTLPGPTYGYMYNQVLNFKPNTYIMCDEYHGNCFGNVDPYWTEFRSYYGTNKSKSNWMHVVINNGYGNFAGPCPGTSNNFYDLFGDANDSGINSLWLYAQNTGSSQDLRIFGESAWQRGWLRKFERYFCIEWHCDYGCECDPTDPDVWYVYKIWPFNDTREVFP
jgi:hypothetical protein